MIFADTGALYVLFVADDAKHKDAVSWWMSDKRRASCLTTDYVLAELLNLMNARGKRHRAPAVGEDLLKSSAATREMRSLWGSCAQRHTLLAIAP